MLTEIDAEINKLKNCKNRDELERHIKEYKNLALAHASNLKVAGHYNMIALKLQAICDKLPAQHLKRPPGIARIQSAMITRKEKARIDAAWEERTKKSHNDPES